MTLFRAEVVLVSFDHLLDHLTADRACLTGSEITVITLVKVNADFARCLHLELFHSVLRAGYNDPVVLCHQCNPSFLSVFQSGRDLIEGLLFLRLYYWNLPIFYVFQFFIFTIEYQFSSLQIKENMVKYIREVFLHNGRFGRTFH